MSTRSTRRSPLVAGGAPISGFSTAVASPGTRAVVRAADVEVALTDHGAKLVYKLLAASDVDLKAVEKLLADRKKDASFISPESAAALLGVSRPTVVRWAAEGLLADHKVNSRHRFKRDDVLRLRDERKTQAEKNRAAAQLERNRLRDEGIDLDVAPTPQELAEAGAARRRGDHAAFDAVMARAQRAWAREAADAAVESPAE